MASGSAIRGSRVGAGPMGEAERATPPRGTGCLLVRERARDASELRDRGRRSRRRGTARAAACRPGATRRTRPPPPRNEPYKTHLAYVKERRSDADGEAILDEALAKLRDQ